MTQTRTEIVVGFFVLVGMACLGYLALKLGKLEVLGNSGYTVYADFPSVAGLKIGDPVEIAGVKIGRVEVMGLADDRARLQLRIQDDVKLQERHRFGTIPRTASGISSSLSRRAHPIRSFHLAEKSGRPIRHRILWT